MKKQQDNLDDKATERAYNARYDLLKDAPDTLYELVQSRQTH